MTASDWETMCAAVATELQANVTGLDTTTVPATRLHQLSPWDPEKLVAAAGERHLAVWPAGEPEVLEALATGAHELHQSYVVLVWEDASQTLERQQADDTADAAFLSLHNAVRGRFYLYANERLGGAAIAALGIGVQVARVWYAGATFSDVAETVRWFAVRLDVRMIQSFS